MIELTTGQPGAGKTLHTLWLVKARAEREGRTVYVSGVADLKVPGWIPLDDATKWHELPAGAIIVIDEAQRVFRPRGTGSQVPAHVAALETHRHAGHDIYVVTQHPKLLDANLRRLVGCHRHVMRAFGAKAAVIHEWNEVRPDPDLSRDGSITTTWPYPREVFSWYRSAEVHTHKARVPMRVWLLIASPLLLAGIAWGVYAMVKGAAFGESKVLAQAGAAQGGAVAPGGTKRQERRTLSTAEWLSDRTPRIAGLPHTAPAYDEVTKPRVAPVPVCLTLGEQCRCYTQQATRMDVADDLCRRLVDRGYFVDWHDGGRSAGSGGGGSAPRVGGGPAGPDRVPAASPGAELPASVGGLSEHRPPASQQPHQVGHPGAYPRHAAI